MNSKELYAKRLEEQKAIADKLNNKDLRAMANVCSWADSDLGVKPIITEMDRRMNNIYIEYYYNLTN